MTALFDVTGRTALVTGSTRGIGAGLAGALARAWATVILHGRERSAVERARESLATALADEGVTATFAVSAFDVRDLTAMRDSIDDIEARTAPIGIPVNNAGMQYRSSTVTFLVEAWRDVLDTNLTAAFALAQ